MYFPCIFLIICPTSSKRTKHFDIKFFYFIDLIKIQEMQVEYCPTKEMVADYMTKPTIESKFIKFRNNIMDAG
jgi:hypothetical protein